MTDLDPRFLGMMIEAASATERLRTQMEAVTSRVLTSRTLGEMIASARSLSDQYSDSIQKGLIASQRLAERISAPLSELFAKVPVWEEHALRLRHHMEDALRPVAGWLSEIPRLQKAYLDSQLHREIAGFAESIAQLQMREEKGGLHRWQEILRDYLQRTDWDSLRQAVEGDVALEDEALSVSAVEEEVAELAAAARNASTLQGFLAWLSKWLRVKTPIRLIALWVLLPYAISVSANLTTPSLLRAFQSVFSGGVGNVWDDARAIRLMAGAIPRDSNVRVLSGRTVRVFASPRRNGRRIDTLDGGTPVMFVSKKGEWAQIEYHRPAPDGNEVATGWVRSKYVPARFHVR